MEFRKRCGLEFSTKDGDREFDHEERRRFRGTARDKKSKTLGDMMEDLKSELSSEYPYSGYATGETTKVRRRV